MGDIYKTEPYWDLGGLQCRISHEEDNGEIVTIGEITFHPNYKNEVVLPSQIVRDAIGEETMSALIDQLVVDIAEKWRESNYQIRY